jgi:hypothetical protein
VALLREGGCLASAGLPPPLAAAVAVALWAGAACAAAWEAAEGEAGGAGGPTGPSPCEGRGARASPQRGRVFAAMSMEFTRRPRTTDGRTHNRHTTNARLQAGARHTSHGCAHVKLGYATHSSTPKPCTRGHASSIPSGLHWQRLRSLIQSPFRFRSALATHTHAPLQSSSHSSTPKPCIRTSHTHARTPAVFIAQILPKAMHPH